jgi:hypothetical protein
MADYGTAGIELMSVNGKNAEFATSVISNSLFVGSTSETKKERGRPSVKFMSTTVRPIFILLPVISAAVNARV